MGSRLRGILLGLLFPACVEAAGVTPVTVYADAGYPPYSYVEEGQVRGIYTDILKLAFSRMPAYQVTIKAEPWKRILAQVSLGHYFAFYPPYQRFAERPFIDRYSVAILEEITQPLCLLPKQHKPVLPAHFPDDFSGLRFLRNNGFLVGGEIVQSAVSKGVIKLDEAADTITSLRMIAAGRADCYLGDPIAVQYEIYRRRLRKPDGQAFELLSGPVLGRETGHIGYAARATAFPFKSDFSQQLDKQLLAMRASGEIAAIQARYLAGTR